MLFVGLGCETSEMIRTIEITKIHSCKWQQRYKGVVDFLGGALS